MRRNSLLLAAALLLVAAVSPFLLAREEKPPARVAKPTWEYRVILLSDLARPGQEPEKETSAVELRFNELGRDGWELCQIHLRVAVFKRPRKSAD